MAILLWLLPSKGKVGEMVVKYRLKKLPAEEYIVLNDVLLPTQKGTSQIDHLVISVYGIFVIETKFYTGWIYGSEYSEYWTQNIFGAKYKFYNPILQNAGHVRVLRYLLKDYGDVFIFPIVAFSLEADLKGNNLSSCVIYWHQVVPAIRGFNRKRLTIEQVHEINQAIEKVRINPKDRKALRKHNTNILISKDRKREAVSNGICPRCGGRLVERYGRYGTFYGCSNYPNCRYTHE